MEELLRLNQKIIHDTPFEDVNVRLANMGLEDLDEGFWNAVRPNLNKLEDIKDWWQVAKGPVEPIIEDEAYVTQALEMLPAEPWTEETWSEWTGKLKEATGRKGKELFMPLRQALTGMSHGPEMPLMMTLIGPEKVKNRLSKSRKAA